MQPRRSLGRMPYRVRGCSTLGETPSVARLEADFGHGGGRAHGDAPRAGQSSRCGNGVGLHVATGRGGDKVADLWLQPNLVTMVDVELKTPLALRTPDGRRYYYVECDWCSAPYPDLRGQRRTRSSVLALGAGQPRGREHPRSGAMRHSAIARAAATLARAGRDHGGQLHGQHVAARPRKRRVRSTVQTGFPDCSPRLQRRDRGGVSASALDPGGTPAAELAGGG